jgi:hypothetical protein
MAIPRFCLTAIVASLLSSACAAPRYVLVITNLSPTPAGPAITLLDGDGSPALAGQVRLRSCQILREGEPPIRSDDVLWEVHGRFDNPAASSVQSLRYGAVPEGWVEDQSPTSIEPGTCIFVTAWARWGYGLAQRAFTVDSLGRVSVLWSSPPVVEP